MFRFIFYLFFFIYPLLVLLPMYLLPLAFVPRTRNPPPLLLLHFLHLPLLLPFHILPMLLFFFYTLFYYLFFFFYRFFFYSSFYLFIVPEDHIRYVPIFFLNFQVQSLTVSINRIDLLVATSGLCEITPICWCNSVMSRFAMVLSCIL